MRTLTLQVGRHGSVAVAHTSSDGYTQDMGTDPAVPAGLRKDLSEAVEILKHYGATEVYLFGSLARGGADEDSDMI